MKMTNLLKKIFGINSTDYGRLIADGALVVDVRSPGEFSGGHIKGALNLPVEQLGSLLKKLPDKDRAIITCCASGMRSAAARSLLKSKGYTQVYNAGPWQRLIKHTR
jgi:phage shock protein E